MVMQQIAEMEIKNNGKYTTAIDAVAEIRRSCNTLITIQYPDMSKNRVAGELARIMVCVEFLREAKGINNMYLGSKILQLRDDVDEVEQQRIAEKAKSGTQLTFNFMRGMRNVR